MCTRRQPTPISQLSEFTTFTIPPGPRSHGHMTVTPCCSTPEFGLPACAYRHCKLSQSFIGVQLVCGTHFSSIV